MRELKFRAWDKIHEKYREPMVYDISHEKIVVRLPIETLKKGEFLLEQDTGLKDKNGKEIYEGDIVRDREDQKCRVKWNESEAHFGLYWGNQMELTDFVWMRGDDLEIIGNIHENPELLEEEE